eukprot:Polyplicarium_translucidae@DN3040_c0_g1_i1.p1
MENVHIQPHVALGRDDVHDVCVVVGDPARAEALAKLCDTHKELAYNREYRTFRCEKDGHTFLCTSHGVGSAGATICFNELIACGAKVILRAGTAGGMQPGMKQGDVVVVHSAAAADGVSARIVPPGMPAVADIDVFNHVMTSAKEMGLHARGGMAVSLDTFYGTPQSGPHSLPMYAKARVDIAEMEAAALFNVCRIMGVKAGALCTLDGNVLTMESGNDTPLDYDPHGAATGAGKERMLRLAVHAAARMVRGRIWDT